MYINTNTNIIFSSSIFYKYCMCIISFKKCKHLIAFFLIN